ncbi:MAG: DUF4212 domain-containing protein [Comamonas sp.]|nr:DUF4212 domain-containing protein [Comamonas sp.]
MLQDLIDARRDERSSSAPASAQAEVFPPDLHDTHHLWLKASLLLLWLLASFGVCFYARDLQSLLAGQLGYWMAAQGSVLIFLLVVLIYSWAMRRFEAKDTTAAAPKVEAPSEAAHRH